MLRCTASRDHLTLALQASFPNAPFPISWPSDVRFARLSTLAVARRPYALRTSSTRSNISETSSVQVGSILSASFPLPGKYEGVVHEPYRVVLHALKAVAYSSYFDFLVTLQGKSSYVLSCAMVGPVDRTMPSLLLCL